MKETILSISEVQREITSLPDRFTEELEATIVTRYGKEVMAILPYHTYKALLETMEALQETLEIMKDEEAVVALRESIQALERGETVSWEEVKKELEAQDEVENRIHRTSSHSSKKHQRYPYQGTNQQAY
jgi:antitoxin YefM